MVYPVVGIESLIVASWPLRTMDTTIAPPLPPLDNSRIGQHWEPPRAPENLVIADHYNIL